MLVWVIVLLAAIAVYAPRIGLRHRWRSWRARQWRTLSEDALKHLLTGSERGHPATVESLAGSVGVSGTGLLDLIARLEAAGVLCSSAGTLKLTPKGERQATQVVRAHRLWESYLADEARIPLAKVHRAAERAEHTLTKDRLDALEAHLGHPRRDPHGDPIPQADGSLDRLAAIPLTDWPVMIKATIVHVEDEPKSVLDQILEHGLKPGTNLTVLSAGPEFLLVSDGEREHRLPPVVAGNIHVQSAPMVGTPPLGTLPLSELSQGKEAEIAGIDPHFRGFARRRLLDLGLTPGASVTAELSNAFGDPRAYRIRGTLIALRNDQATRIWVRPTTPQAEGTGVVT